MFRSSPAVTARSMWSSGSPPGWARSVMRIIGSVSGADVAGVHTGRRAGHQQHMARGHTTVYRLIDEDGRSPAGRRPASVCSPGTRIGSAEHGRKPAGPTRRGPASTNAPRRINPMSFVRTAAMRAVLDDHEGVVSFDVFDTLLWRRYPRPIEVFHDIPSAAARLGLRLPAIDGSAFATARRAAEAAARELVSEELDAQEVTLRQVHVQLALALGWDTGDPALMDDLRTAELAAEADALVADRELLALVGELAAAGRRMVLVSDSYLSAADIMGLVTGAGYPDGAFERSVRLERVRSLQVLWTLRGADQGARSAPRPSPPRRRSARRRPDPGQGARRRAVRWPVARDEAIALTVEETGTESLPMRVCAVGGEMTAGDAGITALRARLIPPDDLADVTTRALTGFERFGRLVYGPALVGFANWVCTRCAELGLRRLYLFQRKVRPWPSSSSGSPRRGARSSRRPCLTSHVLRWHRGGPSTSTSPTSPTCCTAGDPVARRDRRGARPATRRGPGLDAGPAGRASTPASCSGCSMPTRR